MVIYRGPYRNNTSGHYQAVFNVNGSRLMTKRVAEFGIGPDEVRIWMRRMVDSSPQLSSTAFVPHSSVVMVTRRL